jgi:hypothetical protein
VPDYKGAVGVSNDRVEGVERHVPYVTWTESWQIHQRAIFENRPYRGKNDPRPIAERPQFEPSFFERLRAMAGTTNNNKWRDFPRGDALFLGARFRLRRTASMTVMSFAFAHRQGRKPKDDSLPGALRQHRIGDVKIDEYKPGFWHLDILYDTQSSGAGMVQRPRYVRMGPVGPESDFEALRVSSQAFPAIGLPDVKVQH